MADDESVARFRFRLGQAVRWVECPRQRYWIAQRRWAEREGLGPEVDYRVREGQVPQAPHNFRWIYEHDLEAWEES